ncbi:MAG TPA: sugar transferase [Chitinophagaceae bacterium]|nr:sugar transferase [Chitinophagaceae bacterium]
MYRFVKRAFDFIFSLAALVLLSPIFLLIMLVLAFTGEREIFYFQERIGYRNRPFRIWKFATMLKNSPNIGTGVITLRNDPRVTSVGRFLRRTKLNELPQLFNVLIGEMSFVGPRPQMKKGFDLYPPEVQAVIYNTPPGITGIGSIIFRDEEKIVSESSDIEATYRQIFAYKGELETWYQRKISLYTDLMILFLTAWYLFASGSRLAYRVFPSLPVRNF